MLTSIHSNSFGMFSRTPTSTKHNATLSAAPKDEVLFGRARKASKVAVFATGAALALTGTACANTQSNGVRVPAAKVFDAAHHEKADVSDPFGYASEGGKPITPTSGFVFNESHLSGNNAVDDNDKELCTTNWDPKTKKGTISRRHPTNQVGTIEADPNKDLTFIIKDSQGNVIGTVEDRDKTAMKPAEDGDAACIGLDMKPAKK